MIALIASSLGRSVVRNTRGFAKTPPTMRSMTKVFFNVDCGLKTACLNCAEQPSRTGAARYRSSARRASLVSTSLTTSSAAAPPIFSNFAFALVHTSSLRAASRKSCPAFVSADGANLNPSGPYPPRSCASSKPPSLSSFHMVADFCLRMSRDIDQVEADRGWPRFDL